MERKQLILAFVTLFLFCFVTESFSQRRSSRTRPSSESSDRDVESYKSWNDNLAYDIYLGTLGFNGGFSASMKGGVGYKPVDMVTGGFGLKFLYQFVNSIGVDDFSSFSYGYFPYARVKVADQFYLKGEYNFYSFDTGLENSDFERINFTFPMVGGGYVQGYGKWKVGFEILFMLNDRVVNSNVYTQPVEASDLYTFIEYNVAFLYNF